MRQREFVDGAHANQYLHASVVRNAKGIPIYIQEAYRDSNSREKKIYAIGFDLDQRKDVKYNVEELDFNPIPLGFMAIHKNSDYVDSWYMYRSPIRNSRIGLNSSNFMIKHPMEYLTNNVRPLSKPHIMTSKELSDTVLNNFPDYPTLFKVVNQEKRKDCILAFSREFAMDAQHLYHRFNGVPIGEIQKDAPVLFDDFQYLKEALEGALNANS